MLNTSYNTAFIIVHKRCNYFILKCVKQTESSPTYLSKWLMLECHLPLSLCQHWQLSIKADKTSVKQQHTSTQTSSATAANYSIIIMSSPQFSETDDSVTGMAYCTKKGLLNNHSSLLGCSLSVEKLAG